MEIKSVPPVVASAFRQMVMHRPLMMPPKMAFNSTSSVTGADGSISTSRPVSTMDSTEKPVNFFPINLKLMAAGMQFRMTLMAE